MNAEQLHNHPAYLALSPTERDALDSCLASGALDSPATTDDAELLAQRLLQLARGAGPAAIAKAVRSRLREVSGVHRLADRVRVQALNLTHGGLFLATGGPKHEARYRFGVWRNWTADYKIRPRHFAVPSSEDELCHIVASAQKVRAVGAGHSFNASPLCDDTMVSLDQYDQILALDAQAKTIRAQAGIRLRDLNSAIAAHGLALPLLGSTDAQSLGGLVATDLHGSGRDRGFLSEQLRSLRVVAANGVARTVTPGEPLFHAAIGGVGCCGVVTEIELQLVDSFRLEHVSEMVDVRWAEANIVDLVAANEHLSFYYVGGGRRDESIQMHTWNRTLAPLTPNWARKKVRHELQDLLLSAFIPDAAELLSAIDEDSWISNTFAPDRALVMPSSRGFGRRLFYLHDEIEFGVPFELHQVCLTALLELLRAHNFFSIIELRFAPDTSTALLGPGVGRPTAFIELATPLPHQRGHAEVYAKAEAILRTFGGQPHLGKKTHMNAHDMLQTFGPRFAMFQAVRIAQDPSGKFLNSFTRQVFGPC